MELDEALAQIPIISESGEVIPFVDTTPVAPPMNAKSAAILGEITSTAMSLYGDARNPVDEANKFMSDPYYKDTVNRSLKVNQDIERERFTVDTIGNMPQDQAEIAVDRLLRGESSIGTQKDLEAAYAEARGLAKESEAFERLSVERDSDGVPSDTDEEKIDTLVQIRRNNAYGDAIIATNVADTFSDLQDYVEAGTEKAGVLGGTFGGISAASKTVTELLPSIMIPLYSETKTKVLESRINKELKGGSDFNAGLLNGTQQANLQMFFYGLDNEDKKKFSNIANEVFNTKAERLLFWGALSTPVSDFDVNLGNLGTGIDSALVVAKSVVHATSLLKNDKLISLARAVKAEANAGTDMLTTMRGIDPTTGTVKKVEEVLKNPMGYTGDLVSDAVAQIVPRSLRGVPEASQFAPTNQGTWGRWRETIALATQELEKSSNIGVGYFVEEGKVGERAKETVSEVVKSVGSAVSETMYKNELAAANAEEAGFSPLKAKESIIWASKDPEDIILTMTGEANNKSTVGVIFGKGLDGTQPFNSPEEVLEHAKAMGIKHEVDWVLAGSDESDGYKMVVKANIDFDNQDFRLLDVDEESPVYAKYVSSLLGSDVLSDKTLMNTAKTIEGSLAASERRVVGIVKPLTDLPKDSYKRVEKVITLGIENRRWYTDEELIDRGLNETERLGYHSYKAAMDVVYYKMARARTARLESAGWTSVSTDDKIADSLVEALEGEHVSTLKSGFIGKVLDKRPTGDLILDLTSGKSVTGSTPFADVTGFFTYVALKDPLFVNGKYYKTVATRVSKVNPIAPEQVLSYMPGGPSRLKNEWFIKQNIGHLEDIEDLTSPSGKRQQWVMSAPKTLWGSPNGTSARRMVEALEIMRKEAKGTGKVSQGTIDKLRLSHQITIARPSEFDALVKSGKIDLNHPIEAVKAGRTGEYLSKIKAGLIKSADGLDARVSDDAFDAEDDLWDLAGVRTKNSFSPRNDEALKMLDGKSAPLVSPLEMLSRATRVANNAGALSALKIGACKSFSRTYGKVVEPFLKKSGATFKTPEELTVLAANMKIPTQEGEEVRKILRAARVQAQTILRQVRDPSTLTETGPTKEALARLGSWIRRKYDNPLTSSVEDFLGESDPINMMRAVAFKTSLGSFNVSQIPKQSISPVVNAFAVSPVASAMAATASLFSKVPPEVSQKMMGLLLKKYPEFSKVLDEKAIAQYLQLARDLGASDIGDTLAVHHDMRSLGLSTASKLLEAGDSPYVLGTKLGQLFTFNVAFFEALTKLPKGRSTLLPSEIVAMKGRANALSMNQTRMSESAFQRGDFAALSQFGGWQARMFEAMTFGKDLTRAEKVRLISAQAVLFGTRGLIGNRYGAASTQALMSTFNLDDPRVRDSLDNGILSYVLSEMTGTQVDLSGLGPNMTSSFVIDAAMAYLNGSQVNPSDLPPPGVVKGLQMFDAFTTGLSSVFKVATQKEYDSVDWWRENIQKVAPLVSSMGTAYQVAYAAKYDELLTTTGRSMTFADKDALKKAMLKAIGVSPVELSGYLVSLKDVVKNDEKNMEKDLLAYYDIVRNNKETMDLMSAHINVKYAGRQWDAWQTLGKVVRRRDGSLISLQDKIEYSLSRNAQGNVTGMADYGKKESK